MSGPNVNPSPKAAPISAIIHIQNTAPAPPRVMAVATPAMLPVPTRAAAEIVITLLPDPETVEAATLAAAREGVLCVDMSTSPPALARRLAAALRERGAAALDAPVSGGVTGAREGTLTIMVGGAAATGNMKEEERAGLAIFGGVLAVVGLAICALIKISSTSRPSSR